MNPPPDSLATDLALGSGDDLFDNEDLLPATAFQELSQLPQLHPDRVLMRCRNAGVEADARERADLAFGVAKNPIASGVREEMSRAE